MLINYKTPHLFSSNSASPKSEERRGNLTPNSNHQQPLKTSRFNLIRIPNLKISWWKGTKTARTNLSSSVKRTAIIIFCYTHCSLIPSVYHKTRNHYQPSSSSKGKYMSNWFIIQLFLQFNRNFICEGFVYVVCLRPNFVDSYLSSFKLMPIIYFLHQ
jgi:hypothetical protein